MRSYSFNCDPLRRQHTTTGRFYSAVFTGAAACLLMACAAPLKDARGLAVIRGQLPAVVTVPATVQADLSIRADGAGSIPLSSRLYAEPSTRYRLDIFGLLTPVAASWLWRDEGWLLVRHDTREVITGTGNALSHEGVPLNLPDVHAVLGFIWGEPLPGYAGLGTVESLGVLSWVHEGRWWQARFDAATGLCLEAASEDLVLRYARHRMVGGRVIPGELQVLTGGRRLLTLDVKTRVEDPVWMKDPFELTAPADYDSVRVRR